MNRAQRRATASALKARGVHLVTLQGGPMDGWVIAAGAPVLEPDWRERFLESAAEGLYLAEREKGDTRPWSALDAPQRQEYRDRAIATHGAGRYEQRPAEALAVWRAG